jgi:hypothetical protein
MCDECVELDSRIERYGVIQSRIIDQALLGRIKELRRIMEGLKVALHPNQDVPIKQSRVSRLARASRSRLQVRLSRHEVEHLAGCRSATR